MCSHNLLSLSGKSWRGTLIHRLVFCLISWCQRHRILCWSDLQTCRTRSRTRTSPNWKTETRWISSCAESFILWQMSLFWGLFSVKVREVPVTWCHLGESPSYLVVWTYKLQNCLCLLSVVKWINERWNQQVRHLFVWLILSDSISIFLFTFIYLTSVTVTVWKWEWVQVSRDPPRKIGCCS